MSTEEYPAIIDLHVHPRDFGQEKKEDFGSCSEAAVAGGVGTFFAMPNYEPREKVRPYSQERILAVRNKIYRREPYTDIGIWATWDPEYGEGYPAETLARVVPFASGFKAYVEITQGQERALTPGDFRKAAHVWHANASMTQPFAAHVEDGKVEEMIAIVAKEAGHTFYLPHLNNRFLLDAVIKAKKEGLPVFGGVTIDHLTMTEEKVAERGWFARMKPPLTSAEDQEYLLDNLDHIDVIETDHAPHLRKEKEKADEENPGGSTEEGRTTCFGTPSLDAFMPLLLTLKRQGKITREQIIEKTHTTPAKIMGIKVDEQSRVVVTDEEFEFGGSNIFSKCGWNPHEGEIMGGRVSEVYIKGQQVFAEGKLVQGAEPTGRVLVPDVR